MLYPNSNIAEMNPGLHGGLDFAELNNSGIDPASILDFSVNCNPFGPSPQVRESISHSSLDRYPDTTSILLRHKLAHVLVTSPDNIIIGNGSTEIIRLIATAYLNNKDKTMIPWPTYSEYKIACQLVGARIIEEPFASEKNFSFNVADILHLVDIHQPKAIFLCHPNNPTGQHLERDDICNIISAVPNSLVIIDEAYIAFADHAWSALELINSDRNIIVVRSMTKDYSLAGLRLGYAVASASIISTLLKIKPPWNVNSIAQEAGIIAIESHGYFEECKAKLRETKTFLVGQLTQLGLSVIPSHTNFFLVKVGNATKFYNLLLKKGILVRDCSSFGLPEYVRISPRTIPECQLLIDTIKQAGIDNNAG